MTTNNFTNMRITMKTDCRGFVFMLTQLANTLAVQARKGTGAFLHREVSDLQLANLVMKFYQDSTFRVSDLKYRKFFRNNMRYDSLTEFSVKLNLADSDIVLKVNKTTNKLYVGGIYACTLNCPNEALIHILRELYDVSKRTKTAA